MIWLRLRSLKISLQAPDSKTLNEEHDLDRQQKAAFVAGIWQDIRERKKYASRIFCLISICSWEEYSRFFCYRALEDIRGSIFQMAF